MFHKFNSYDPKEPFPPSAPVLEDTQFIRILKKFGYREPDKNSGKRTPVLLSQSEIRTLAQHHLDCVDHFDRFLKTGGSAVSSDFDRADCHLGRFRQFASLLSEEDREKFREITRIRKVYLETLRDPKEESV